MPTDGDASAMELMRTRSKLKVAKMMVVVVVIFVISWAPLYGIFAAVKLASFRAASEDTGGLADSLVTNSSSSGAGGPLGVGIGGGGGGVGGGGAGSPGAGTASGSGAGGDQGGESSWWISLAEFAPIAQWLGASNSCINPVLYGFFNKKYRKGFAAILRSKKCCGMVRYDVGVSTYRRRNTQCEYINSVVAV